MDFDSLVLLEIASRMPSTNGSIFLSSGELGFALKVSQQTASRYIAELEKKGLVKRVVKKRGQEITLTKEGVMLLKGMHEQLNSFLTGKKSLTLEGKVSIGLGEGAYYVKIYEEKIEKLLGFIPYHGTLNIRVGEIPANLPSFASKEILPFEKDGRSFGGIKILKAKLISGRKSIDCSIILPERTHHKNELEIISRHNLRKKIGLSDGSRITVTVSA